MKLDIVINPPAYVHKTHLLGSIGHKRQDEYTGEEVNHEVFFILHQPIRYFQNGVKTEVKQMPSDINQSIHNMACNLGWLNDTITNYRRK